MRLTRRVWIILAALVFIVSLAIRVVAIRLTPRDDFYVDLEIYRASAELILHHVNPYDFSDKVAVRSALCQQAHSPILHDQASWNYYATGNLPLNLLFFAGLSAISDTPRFHRYSYAFFDSVLSTLIVWFVIRHWRRAPSAISAVLATSGMSLNAALFVERIVIGVALGCLSPILLKSGTVFPEDKGVEILLILATLACFLSHNERLWYWGGAVFLGLSIAFKGLGLFLVPLFVVGLVTARPPAWLRLFVFAFVVAFLGAVWIPPFWPGVAHMATHRLELASGLPPQHASIWVVPSISLPSLWKYLRAGTTFVVVGIALLGYWRKRINIDLLCATLLLVFVAVWLINGSMDRQNIGILPALLLLGTWSVNAVMLCALPYLFITGVGGFMTKGQGLLGQYLESVGMLLFIGTYLGILCWLSFAPRPKEQLEAVDLFSKRAD